MFQIQALAYTILAIITTAFGKKYEETKPRAEEIVEETRQSLDALAQKVLDGKIDIKDVPLHLEQEFLLLKTELLEATALGISFVETTINDLMEKFQEILNSLLPKKD